MLIKVCGMRDADNIHAVEQLGVDMIGFVFDSRSPRYVEMRSSRAGILPDYAAENFASNHFAPSRVGVFVDEMPQNIITRVYNFSLDYVQLHGHESRVMIENLRRTLNPDIRQGIKIIKAISVSNAGDLDRTSDYEGVVDLFLFDTKTTLAGGSGKQFDWSVLGAYQGDVPFLLSGGIGPDDLERVKAFHHPRCIGIDLNSRFEVSPALKDVNLLRQFITNLRQ